MAQGRCDVCLTQLMDIQEGTLEVPHESASPWKCLLESPLKESLKKKNVGCGVKLGVRHTQKKSQNVFQTI